MDKKNCNGYESMYMFLSEDDLQKHIEECEICRAEHEKLQKISALIQEAKPYIKNKKRRKNAIKAACAMFVVLCTGACFQLFFAGTGFYNDLVAQNSLTIEEMGLPVDEYGFLMVD